MTEPRPNRQQEPPLARVAAKARHELQHLPDPLRLKAEEILRRLAENPTQPISNTGRMRVGVANRYAYHCPLDYHNRMYWTVRARRVAVRLADRRPLARRRQELVLTERSYQVQPR